MMALRRKHGSTGAGRRAFGVALPTTLLLIATMASASPLAVQRRTLNNGARLLVSEQHALPMVVVQIMVDAGARRDPSGKEGLAGLTADLLTEGTKKRTAVQISETADFIGAAFDTGADVDFASLSLTMLTKDLDTGFDLLSDALLHPSFPEAEVTRRREATLASLQAEEDEPGRVANRRFLKLLFGDEPYGHPVVGSTESVRKLTRADILKFYQENYGPENAIISIAGDVSADDMAKRMESILAEWKGVSRGDFVYPPEHAHESEAATIAKPLTQANIVLGERGIARDNPDYYAVTVMNFILGGGGFTSRLTNSVRVEGGLAYSVGSVYSVNKAPGSFQVIMQTKNASAAEAIQRTCSELDRIRQSQVSDEELDGAKLYLTGSFPMRLDTNMKLAGFAAQVEFFHLGDDYADSYASRINAVSKEDIQRAAQKYLHPDNLDLVVVGNLDTAKVSAGPPCAKPAPTP
ncbi:MAG: insulinase family protein [Deltaproteobacteria bacterium]|nr:insulinase family protein [Deltaproteobacteria bacterium]